MHVKENHSASSENIAIKISNLTKIYYLYGKPQEVFCAGKSLGV